jgi:cyanophycinase-like exopeptidase
MQGQLVIMGSGETAPTMVSIHRMVAAMLPAGASPVLIETPYGFQENVAEISARACQYFARSVGLQVSTAPGLRGAGDTPGDGDRGLAMVRTADWLFSGPGSPTYAMKWWSERPVAQALRDRMRQRRGVTVFASAAAATLGHWTVPVYEVYKAGSPAHWVEGLDLLQHLDLRVALIPHYDNTEGGTHDTRFCYLGERRLRIMEQELPDDAAVLGVDEHTAVLIDPSADTVRVSGRGALTVRRHGSSTVLPAGVSVSLAELRALAHHGTIVRVIPRQATVSAPALTVSEMAAGCERRFGDGLARRDAAAMAQAVLDLESAVHDWRGDTEEDDGAEQARAVLRTLILRLGQTAAGGLVDPADLFRPLVEPLLGVRERLRARRDYVTADEVRVALAAAGVELKDTTAGADWSLRPAAAIAPRSRVSE